MRFVARVLVHQMHFI